MRALLTSFLLVIVALVRGATVTDLVQTAGIKIPTNAALVFTPISAPLWVEDILTTGDVQGTRVDKYGRMSIDLAGGYYSLQVGTDTKRFTIGVPSGTGTYKLSQLVTNTIAFLTNLPVSLYEVTSRKGIANGYASLGSDGLVPADQLPAGNGGGGGGGVGSFYTNNVLATSSATQLGATNGSNTVVSAIVAGSRVTFTFNARPATVSAGNGIFVTNVGGSNFIVAGSITAAEFTALTNAVAGLTNLVAAKEGTNNSTHFGYLRFPRTNDYLDFNQTWNIRRYPDDTLHFDYPDVAATPLLIRPNGITVSNIYIPSTNVFIQWNGVWSLVAWADGSFRLLNDDTGTTPFSVGSDGTVTAPAFVGDGSGLTGLPGLSGLAELHFENESGTPTPGDAIVFRSGGRIWIQNVGGSQTDLEGVATTATSASVAATAAWATNTAQQLALTGLTNRVNAKQEGSALVSNIVASAGVIINLTSNGVSFGSATNLNFIEGSNVVLRFTNVNGKITLQINASGSGAGGGITTNDVVTLLANGVPLITVDAIVFNTLTVSNTARFVGAVSNLAGVVMSGLPGTGTNLTVDASGVLRLASLPAGGTGSAAWNETNIVISSTNNVLWDVAAFDRAVIKALTNLNLLVLSNVASMTKKAHMVWQGDTNGTRTVRFAVAGGRFDTNGFTEPTTNANKQTILEVTQASFPTNAAVSGFVTNITAEPFTNSLASAGGGGGGGGCDTVNDASLAAYWKFDEASGDRSDSKNGNTLVDHNTVTSVGGKLSNAAEFTAANSEYMDHADNADLSVSGDFSIGFWINLKSSRNHGILSKASEYYVSTSGDQIQFNVFDSVFSSQQVLSTEHLNNGTWYYVVCWYDSNDKKLRVSVNDGTAAVSSGALSNGPADGTSTFYVGLALGGSLLLDAYIDELLLTKRVLTSGESTSLYNSGSACRPSGL